jgi:hypothetical protein
MALKIDPITGELVEEQSEQLGGINPKVADYLKQKYNMGEFSVENRQKLVDSEDVGMGDRVSAMLAAAGAGFLNKDPFAAGQSVLKSAKADKRQKIEDFDKGRAGKMQEFAFDRDLTKAQREDQILAEKQDVNSERSKAVQQSLVDDYGMDPAVASKITAEQGEARIPSLKAKMDRQFKEREFSERQKDRQLQREIMQSTQDIARKDKLDNEAKLSDKQIGQITEFDDALSSIESIKRQKDDFDTGPVSAIQSGIAGTIGIDDSKKSAFKAQVQDDLARYIKSISGGAVSDEERAFLIQNLPTMKDNDETFKAKLDVVESRLKRNRENFLKNAEKAGKNVKKFKREEAPKEETKTINGKQYRKVQGGWEEI